MFSLSYANCGADFTDTLMNLGMGEAGESQLLRDITPQGTLSGCTATIHLVPARNTIHGSHRCAPDVPVMPIKPVFRVHEGMNVHTKPLFWLHVALVMGK